MPDVKPSRRPYRSRRRAVQAAETREAVLSAAHELFVSEGWTKTTIASIATAGGVSNETVYASFGSKKALLEELVIRTVRGGSPDVTLIEQDIPGRIALEKSQSRQIELFADDIASVLARVAPLMNIARVAAETDATIADLCAGFHRGRRKNLEWFGAALLRNGSLKGGMDATEAGRVLWRLASPDLFLLMRQVEGLSHGAYTDWLAETLKVLLLYE